MKDIVNISVEYPRYNFVANFYNCLLIEIKKNERNNSTLVFLNESGETKTLDLSDEQYMNVKVKSICQT